MYLTFCLGLPGETKDTLHKTVNFINETSPDSTQFSFATPFPGTEYFDYLRNEGKISGFNWDCFDGNIKYVVKGQGITFEELKEIKDAFGGDSKP